jgi:hypothetical protein
MKAFFGLMILSLSFNSFAQTLVSNYFELGPMNNTTELRKMVRSGGTLTIYAVKSGAQDVATQLVQYVKMTQYSNVLGPTATIACVGDTSMVNKVLTINKLKACAIISNQTAIYEAQTITAADAAIFHKSFVAAHPNLVSHTANINNSELNKKADLGSPLGVVNSGGLPGMAGNSQAQHQ